MRTTVDQVRRIRAVLEPGDERIEVQTAMAAFYIVPDVIEVEFNDAPGDLLRVFRVTVTGSRYRRLKDGVKLAGEHMSATFYPGTVSEFTGKMPAALHNLVRDLWWSK